MRWLVRALASLVMLLLMLGIMVVLMPKDGVLDLAAQRFEAATGRKLEIGSGAKVTLWEPDAAARALAQTALARAGASGVAVDSARPAAAWRNGNRHCTAPTRCANGCCGARCCWRPCAAWRH